MSPTAPPPPQARARLMRLTAWRRRPSPPPLSRKLLSIDYSLCCLAVRKDRPLISALFAVALGGG
ncbi:hypothetical protein CBM2589_A60047 [Cupriavidus taiwanensis]|uniref:Uncharacterized protein n=1 Tax=Cupriavidus taiwanensis TaxID=164546 RepID=A0A375C4Q2_9BURK|nr:hypothetical protein CBM2589_A60047 [Cupriavidus taiwanensis]